MKVYVSGPITGYPDHNKPAFDKATAELRAEGYEVVNVFELHGSTERHWVDYIALDILELERCDAVYFLDGWEKSYGSIVEMVVACRYKKRLMFQSGAYPSKMEIQIRLVEQK